MLLKSISNILIFIFSVRSDLNVDKTKFESRFILFHRLPWRFFNSGYAEKRLESLAYLEGNPTVRLGGPIVTFLLLP